MRGGVINYTARLARLERLAGKGAEHCPFCRLFLRHTWAGTAKPTPSPVVYTRCDLCGGRLPESLAGYAEEERVMARLALTATIEDFYTDRRAWAAQQWLVERDDALAARKKQLLERARRERPHDFQGANRPDQKDGPNEKLHAKLSAECSAALKRIHQRLGARYGKEPFPDLFARLADIDLVDRDHLCGKREGSWRVPFGEMYELQREEAAWLRCAEAERVVLGEALALTLERAADCDRRAMALIDEARHKHEEETAEQERRDREFLERSREFMERRRAATAASPAPVITPPAAAPVQRRPAAAPAVADAPAPHLPAQPQPSIFLPATPPASHRGRRPRRR